MVRQKKTLPPCKIDDTDPGLRAHQRAEFEAAVLASLQLPLPEQGMNSPNHLLSARTAKLPSRV